MPRERRKEKLRSLKEFEAGQQELHALYQKAIGIAVDKLPADGLMGELMIETILDSEFPGEDDKTE